VSALVFMDTETTGLSLDDDVWEFAAVRRETDGSEAEHHLFIQHDVEKCCRLPEPFLADHRRRFPISLGTGWHSDAVPPERAALYIAALFVDRPHAVGAVPNFDTERLALLLGRFGIKPGWHYHLIDVENLAVGWIAGLRAAGGGENGRQADLPALPWDSDDLSRAVGVEPPTTERHTAMGDVRWAMALYDAIVGGAA
jgi:hypothetical protein